MQALSTSWFFKCSKALVNTDFFESSPFQKNTDKMFWPQIWPLTEKPQKLNILHISGCGAVGSARRLGRRCRRFESCHSDQKSAENEAFCPTFGWFFAYNRLLSTTSENSPDGRKAACASFTAQAAFFQKAISLTTALQFLGAVKSTIKQAKTKATSVRL